MPSIYNRFSLLASIVIPTSSEEKEDSGGLSFNALPIQDAWHFCTTLRATTRSVLLRWQRSTIKYLPLNQGVGYVSPFLGPEEQCCRSKYKFGRVGRQAWSSAPSFSGNSTTVVHSHRRARGMSYPLSVAGATDPLDF